MPVILKYLELKFSVKFEKNVEKVEAPLKILPKFEDSFTSISSSLVLAARFSCLSPQISSVQDVDNALRICEDRSFFPWC